MRGQGPRVRCKLAISLDGRCAAADGGARWITGEAARADVQRLRAECCAILTGSGTVLADDPRLDVRIARDARQPLRIVLDRRLRCPPAARLLAPPGRVVMLTGPGRADTPAAAALTRAGAEVVELESDAADFPGAALRWLAERHEVNEVLVETGPTLAGALVRTGLVHELIVYQAPLLLGSRGLPMFDLPDQGDMGAARRIVLTDTRRVGRDFRHIYTFEAH
jgi:diaminohydroxyphosphoribosylaminopyrimidine deaminase/5-amino-6-(5-phosphoribosylamino)uracil reductase